MIRLIPIQRDMHTSVDCHPRTAEGFWAALGLANGARLKVDAKPVITEHDEFFVVRFPLGDSEYAAHKVFSPEGVTLEEAREWLAVHA